MTNFNTFLQLKVEELSTEVHLGISPLFSVFFGDFTPHVSDGGEVANVQSSQVGDLLSKQVFSQAFILLPFI